MVRGIVLGLALAMAGVWPVLAEIAAPVQGLTKALRMAEVIEVLREEGLAGGAELAADLPGGPDDPQWRLGLERLYDTAALQAGFDAAFAQALGQDADAIAKATEFFASDLGQRALGLELEARRAMVDPAVEKAAAAAFAALKAENPHRSEQLRRFVLVNDLIESNVMGSLNSNLAFFRGVAAEGGEAYGMTESDMLAEVWAGEELARKNTAEWIFPFLAMAYAPLTDDELQAYIDFSETAAGKKVNAAMFEAFDAMFIEVSTELGRAVARQMAGENI